MPNLELEKVRTVPPFRKIAIGTWRTAYDPSVYGTMSLPMDRAMDYIARFRAATGIRLTVSHLMAKAFAATLQKIPDANSILRFHRPYRRKRIGVFFQVAMTEEGSDKIDLSGCTLYDVENKDLPTLIAEFEGKVNKVRARKDEALEKTRGIFRWLPFWASHWFLRTVSFLSYTLNLALPGLARDPFGSVMITNIGSLGLDMAYVPLVPYSRVPILLALGAVAKVPVVEGDEVVIRQQMKVNATFDHRFIDGAHAAIMSKVLHRAFEDPDAFFGPIPQAAEVAAAPALDAPKAP